jgi:hypothetical protein
MIWVISIPSLATAQKPLDRLLPRAPSQPSPQGPSASAITRRRRYSARREFMISQTWQGIEWRALCAGVEPRPTPLPPLCRAIQCQQADPIAEDEASRNLSRTRYTGCCRLVMLDGIPKQPRYNSL